METVSFIVKAVTPGALFMILSMPVQKRILVHEIALIALWLCNLGIPLYHAGQLSYICLMPMAVWCWASGMKMASWIFSMSMEERRHRPFIWTLLYWRTRTTPVPKLKRDKYLDIIVYRHLVTYIKRQLLLDAVGLLLAWADIQRPIHVFAWAIGKSTTVADPMAIIVSFVMCTAFSIFLQAQIQLSYDAVLLAFSALYRLLPAVQHWCDQRRRMSVTAQQSKHWLYVDYRLGCVKAYLEDALTMPPLFDSPWSATSLRDFWSRRWHKTYNDCFFRLGYVPTRHVIATYLPQARFLRRTLPAFMVFVFSGIMHEYFLYCATGPTIYHQSSVPAGGWQMIFFLLQMIGISIGDQCLGDGRLGGFWAIVFMILTSHFFVIPYLLTDYLSMNQFSVAKLLAWSYQYLGDSIRHV